MLRKSLLILCVLCTSLWLTAQIDKTRTWYFGQGIGLHFEKDGKLKVRDSFENFTYEGTAIWNSINGAPLYYSNGAYLYDSNHKNKNPSPKFFINDNSATQNAVMTSIDGELLHIFTPSPYYRIGGYRHHLFNIAADTFLFRNHQLQKGISECQTLVNHQNGKWQWVVSHSLLGDTLYTYLINEEGLQSCPVVSHAGPFYLNSNPGQGVMKFSPDGEYLFIATWNLAYIVACSFNNQTGEVKELFRFKNFDYYPYGLEIHEMNLFVSMGRPRDIIYQYSLDKMDSTSVFNSRKTLFDTAEFDKIGQIQMAPDGNMYVNEYEKNFLGKITKQSKDNYTFSFTKPLFGSKVGYGGFPNFNASYFHEPSINFEYVHTCHSHTFSFKATDTFTANTFTWNFSKGISKESKTGKELNYTFTDTGKWNVQLIASNGTRTDTIHKNIEVFEIVPQGFLGTDYYYTQGQMVQGLLQAPTNQHCSHWWKLGDTTEQRGNSYSYTDTGTYICKTTNRHFCHRWDSIRVRICDSIPKAELSRIKDTLFLKQTATRVVWYKNEQEVQRNTNRLTLKSEGDYSVVLSNVQGCADTSEIQKVTFLYAGLQRIPKTGVFIYPNPNSGTFTIGGLNADTPLKIVDLQGRKIGFERKKNILTLDQPSIGMYYLLVEGKAFRLVVE